ncbi:MAG: YhbY family RNA-binding protein [Candidatus Bathyarchaeota archaeon]|nr:MAG: YhbY family RNA-binding protein [Candidatus Bathyarchaeota archaeon]
MPKLRSPHAHTLREKGGERTLSNRMKRRIKQELSTEKPTVWIGKEGATDQIISEVNSQLKKREMIKAKILKTALQEERAKDIATKVATQTESTLIEVRGHTFMLYKPRQRRDKSTVSKTRRC